MLQPMPSSPIILFCAAASADQSALAQWEIHLLPLQRAGYLNFLSDDHILAGDDRLKQLYGYLDEATCVIFLISVDFFADPLCLNLMQHALQRQQEHGIRIIPLLLRPSEWQASEL